MTNNIKPYEVIEGNLKAVKDTSDFGGANMWNLKIKELSGYWSDSVQWMDVQRIQPFFKEKLPMYKEISSSKYELINN